MATITMHNPFAAVIQVPNYSGGQRSWTLTSTLWAAASFVGPTNPFGSGSCKLDAVRIYLVTAVGSPKITAYLYSDTSGVPNASIQAAPESGVLAAGWNDFTWSTKPALTEGTLYWIVFAVTSGTSIIWAPFYSSTYGLYTNISATEVASGRTWGITGISSADGGATWAGTTAMGLQGVRIKLTNDTDVAFFGFPTSGAGAFTASANYYIEGTQEVGVVYTTPADAKIRVKGASIPFRKIGSPGNISMKIYAGDAVVATATSTALPAGNMYSSPYVCDFSTPVELAANTKYRFVLAAASGDQTTNYYYLYASTWDPDADSRTLHSWGLTLCQLEGGAWTEYADYTAQLHLIPDTLDQFGTISGGGAINLDKLGAL